MINLKDCRGVIRLNDGEPRINILHTGDLCPVDAYETPFCTGTAGDLFKDFVELAGRFDAVITNLESPLGDTGAPIFKCGPNFRVPANAISGLRQLKITHACLANNHIKDYGAGLAAGTAGLLASAGIVPLGLVEREDAVMAPEFIECNGMTLALFNVAEAEYAYPRNGEIGASCLNEGELILKIRSAREKAQAVVVRVHAGREYVLFPATWLRHLFKRLVDAGADAVIADHPHVPQGLECHGRGVICYSMGNFVFDFSDMPRAPAVRIGYALACGFSGAGLARVELLPYAQQPDFSVRLIRDARQFEAFMAFLDEISRPLSDEQTATAVWEEYVRREGARSLESIHTTLDNFPTEDPETARKIYRSMSAAINSCRTHYEVARLFVRLGYEERLTTDSAAATVLAGADRALQNLAGELW